MKRSRAEVSQSELPSKTQRRYKETTPKSTPKSSPKFLHKPRKPEADEKQLQASISSFTSPPSPSCLGKEMEGSPCPAVGGDSLGELSGWWSWGVDVEMLLGWFPFVDEDFLCHESRGGGWGAFWEDGVGDLHDIWQLQSIHEVPNSTK